MEAAWGTWGAILVGLCAAVSITLGARLAGTSEHAPSAPSPRLIRVFAFGSGAFFCAVCLDFLPDAWSAAGEATAWWLFLGAIAMWTANALSDGWFTAASSPPEQAVEADPNPFQFTPVSAIVLAAALSFHTFLEGAAVAVSFHHFSWRTLAFALAVILHKLPEGVLWALALTAVFANDQRKLLRVLLVPALCTLIGVILGILFANQASSRGLGALLAITAGAMLYIAFTELMPAVREINHPRRTSRWFLLGVAVMTVLSSVSDVLGD